MRSLRPSPDEERWLVLASRFRKQSDAPIFVGHIAGWRCTRLVTRCAFFVLGMVAAAMTASIFSLLHIEHFAVVAGLVLVAAAEWLIVRRRLVFSGIEEAFEIAGLLMIVFGVFDQMLHLRDAPGYLPIAAAFVVAGLRLLNPLFAALGAVTLSFAFQDAFGTYYPGEALWAGLFCYAIAWIALGLGAITFKRPAYDRMLDWPVLTMPIAGYLWLAGPLDLAAVDYLHDRSFTVLLRPLCPLIFGVVALAIGIRRRTHAPLLAFMVCIACVAYELRRLTGLPLELRLILWGSLALAAALGLDRFLRTPRAGVTSQKMSDGEGALDLVELGGTAAIAPHGQPEPSRGLQPGGGQFGGGGASGGY